MTSVASSEPGTPLGEALDNSPITARHVRYWLLAGLGIMLDGFDFFVIGVAMPLVAEEFGLSATQKGLVSAAAIVGAVVGATLLGPLGDRIGRRRIFQLDLWMFVVFSALCIVAWDATSLMVFRFLLGIAIGLDYPIAASYLAETLPARNRGRWLVGAFSLQAAGIVLGAIVGVVVLNVWADVEAWRVILGFGIVPALIIIFLRRGTPESPRWLAQNGREQEAIEVTEELVGRPVVVAAADRQRATETPEGLRALFQPELFRKRMLRRTILASVPWFLMDIATYGVGIFTPTLLAALALAGPDATFVADDIASTEGTALLDVFLVVGFVLAIVLVDRLGRIPLQLVGFAVMTFALLILGVAEDLDGGGSAHLGMVIVGFILFNTFMNMGPNATTYALPCEIYPQAIRAAGHGFAAGMAKLGAATGVLLFPILTDEVGTSPVLYGIAGACALAFAITFVFRIETRGRSLAELTAASPVTA